MVVGAREGMGLSRGTSPPSSVGVTLTPPEFGGGLLLFPQTDTAPRCPKYKNRIFCTWPSEGRVPNGSLEGSFYAQ